MIKKYTLAAAFFLSLICILYPWLTIQANYYVTGNVSWLMIAADRFINGQNMLQHIYETNPPLSILIYTPHALFAHIFNLPLPITSFYISSIFVIASFLVTCAIIKKFSFLRTEEKAALLLACLAGMTLGITVFYSEREHFIALGIVPFILCQYALTHNIQIKRELLLPSLIIGAMCILIKPHYGLFPTIMLIDRTIRRKNLKTFRDPDFITLSIMTLAYILLVTFMFQDYVTTILPDVLSLYANSPENLLHIINTTRVQLTLYIILLLFEAFRDDLSKDQRRFVLFLYTACLIFMVPYYVQAKGFYNHLLPANALFLMAISMSISFRIKHKYGALGLIIPMIAIAVIINLFSPLSTAFPKQSDIPNLPVAKYLDENCRKPCTFFAFHGDIEIFNPTAAAMGYTHASRFPSFWFLPAILKAPDKYDALRQKYTQFVLEDLQYYKPSLIILAKDLPVETQIFNFLDYFGKNQGIKEIFEEKYKHIEILEIDRTDYFKGTTLEQSYIYKYDVYRRID